MKEHEDHFELEREPFSGESGVMSIDELAEAGKISSKKFRDGELKLDFETAIMFRRHALTELALMLMEYLKKIKPDNPAHADFKYHLSNTIQLKANEEILDRELRSARQRASDLEFKVLLMIRERETIVQAEEEIKINNDELRELYLENERLKNENAELIKLL
jgi:hypothetical protein